MRRFASNLAGPRPCRKLPPAALPVGRIKTPERMDRELNENQPAKPRKKRLIVLIVVAALVVLAVAAYFIARTVAHSFIQSEISTRSDWEIDTGDVADREAAQQVTVYTDPVEATIEITQIVPDEYEDEGFTYYDEEVQDRLASTLLGLTQEGNYTMGSPLAILNPFGTGSNGLYLYFGTSNPTQVQYTVSVEDDAIPDYTAWANNAGEDGYSRVQEFLLIGLVPGMKPGTGAIGCTAAVALVSFIYFLYFGVKKHGLFGYLKSLAPAGVSFPMNIFVWVIEVFSLLLRLVTLAVRLFCNMFAGHIVMGSFAIMASIFAQPLLAHFSAMNAVGALPSVAWVLILLIIYAVELIVAFVQAYVFTVLSAVYIQIAEADAH